MSEVRVSKFWEWFGKLALVVAVAGGLVGLWSWYQAPSRQLEARVERGALYVPPQYKDFSTAVGKAISPESLQGTIREAETRLGADSNSLPETLGLIPLVSQMLQEKLGVDDPSINLNYNGYWHAVVINTGDVSVDEVVLRLPDASVYTVRREDQADPSELRGPLIELGKIGASQRVYVTAWTHTPPVSWPMKQEPTLHHAGGVGRIEAESRTNFDIKSLLLAGLVIALFISVFDALLKPFLVRRLMLPSEGRKAK